MEAIIDITLSKEISLYWANFDNWQFTFDRLHWYNIWLNLESDVYWKCSLFQGISQKIFSLKEGQKRVQQRKQHQCIHTRITYSAVNTRPCVPRSLRMFYRYFIWEWNIFFHVFSLGMRQLFCQTPRWHWGDCALTRFWTKNKLEIFSEQRNSFQRERERYF